MLNKFKIFWRYYNTTNYKIHFFSNYSYFVCNFYPYFTPFPTHPRRKLSTTFQPFAAFSSNINSQFSHPYSTHPDTNRTAKRPCQNTHPFVDFRRYFVVTP